ncbi:MAG: TolC family protein [Spirochaetaceae bacterium]|jgi:outer membrane protein TolC|nr:TolC family protein [Spirochaetaceae bacterium]
MFCRCKNKYKKSGRQRSTAALLIISALFVGAAGRTAAQEGGQTEAAPPKRIITLEEAVRLGIENNLSLESSRISMQTKKRTSDLAWNQFLPAVGFSGSVSSNFIPAESSTLSWSTMPPSQIDIKTNSLALGVQGQIAWQGLNIALFEGLRKLKLDYQSGLVTYDKARIQLERDIRKAYYNILLVQEQIELLRQSYNNAQRQEDSARANYRGGLAPELYVMQAQVQRENLRPQMDQAETGLRLSKASFAMNLGIPFEDDFDLEPVNLSTEFIPPDVQEMIRQAANNKPDITELKSQLIAMQSARTALKFQLWTPSINLSFGLNTGSTFTKVQAGGAATESWSDPTLRDSFSLQLMWTLNNVLPFTTQGTNLVDLDANIRTMNIGLAQAVRGSEIEIYNTMASLEQARVSAEAGRYTVELADRSYRLTTEAYQAGLQTLLEVQNAELQLRQARIGLLQQQVNFLSGLIDLEYAIGAPFGTLLEKR